MRIVRQTGLPNGVLTEYEDGSTTIVPYKIDYETGEEYMDLDPNYDFPELHGDFQWN